MAKVVGFELKFDGIKETVKDMASLEKAIGGVNQELDEQIAKEKKLKRSSTASREELGAAAKKTAELRQQKQQLNLATRNIIKAEKAETKSLNELSAKHNLLVQRLRNTNRATKQGKAEFDKLTKTVRKSSDELKKLEAAYGSNTRNIGNYSTALKGLGSQLLGAFGVVGGLALLATGLRKVVSIGKEFEAGTARLKAITEATNAELKTLTDTAKKLGETTFFTATEVLGLQTELAKLGFTTQQIIETQAAVLDLSLITGVGLAEAAELAGSTLRAFNLDASESGRVVDVMAKSFSSSALNFEKFSAAITKVAPVAATFGFTIEETTALLGQLSNAGFRGEQAGTALRNILLNLADANGKLAKELGGNVKSFDDLIPALIELRDGGIDLNETLQLTDKRSVAAFNQFLRTAEGATELKLTLDEAAGSAASMALIIGDTLTGDIKKLASEMEGLVLKNGGEFNTFLRNATTFARQAAFELSNLGKTIKLFAFSITPFTDIAESDVLTDFILDMPAVRDELAKFNKLTFKEVEENLESVRKEFTLLLQTNENLQATIEESEVAFDRFFIRKFVEYDESIDKTVQTLDDYNLELESLHKNFVLLAGDGGDVPKTITNFITLNKEISELKKEQGLLDLSTESGRNKFSQYETSIEKVGFQITKLKNELGLLKSGQADEAGGKIFPQLDAQFNKEAAEEFESAVDTYLSGLKKVDDFLKSVEEVAGVQEEKSGGAIGEEDAPTSILGKLFTMDESEQQKLVANTSFAVETISQGINTLSELSANATARRTKDLEDQLEAGIITEEEFAKRKEAIDKKAFKAQKRLQLIQATANLAQSLLQVAAVSNIDPFGINRTIQMAIMAGLGAAQIAVIASQKFKEGGQIPFAEGGMIEGASHENGGVQFQAAGRLMEAEGGEVILNKAQQQRLGGRQTFKAIGVPGFFQGGGQIPNGGILPETEGISASLQNSLFNQQSESTMRVINVVTDTTERQNNIHNTEANFRAGEDLG